MKAQLTTDRSQLSETSHKICMPPVHTCSLPQEISFRKLFFSSWNGSSFVNDSNGDSFMASSPPFLLVSCTPSRVCGREVESWGGSDLVAGVKESQREREREREFQGWRRTILSPLTQFMADHSTLALSLSLFASSLYTSSLSI